MPDEERGDSQLGAECDGKGAGHLPLGTGPSRTSHDTPGGNHRELKPDTTDEPWVVCQNGDDGEGDHLPDLEDYVDKSGTQNEGGHCRCPDDRRLVAGGDHKDRQREKAGKGPALGPDSQRQRHRSNEPEE